MKAVTVVAVIVCALVTGCTDDTPDCNYARSTNATYVCIGMERSARFGTCAGCRLDAERMSSFLTRKFGYPGVLLISESATKARVAEEISSAIAKVGENDLFILYYSGHGGQENLSGIIPGTSEPEGSDQEDEYLCLYDTYMLDDEVWNMLIKCKGRVFCCFDACHSQTMYRSVRRDMLIAEGKAVPLSDGLVRSKGFRFGPKPVALSSELRMLCWSGCLEGEYSYGSSMGGLMTNSILKRWHSGLGYGELWRMVVEDVRNEQPGQHPYSTVYGTGFTEAFR